jgi:hypothetical protein
MYDDDRPDNGPGDTGDTADQGRVLSVRLDVHLDAQPITGRLRTEQGEDEQFVGWLGFIDTLRRLSGYAEPNGSEPASS